MFKKTLIAIALSSVSLCTLGADVPITGNVESKCIVQTDTLGVYGNPTPSVLSTDAVDGGMTPIVRFDVIQASFYKARITYPNAFSSSPALSDVPTWTGSVAVGEVSDTNMSAYSSALVTYDNVTEVDLTVAGSTWFEITSRVDYGYTTALPAGTYRAILSAECIAL
jgi:hypothetical protein